MTFLRLSASQIRRQAALLGALALMTWGLGGCGQTPPGPVDVVEGYVGAVAEGNFAGACGWLNDHARMSLARTMHSAQPCAALLARCFPNQATLLGKDQTQLLYATVQIISINRARDDALTGNTEVAKAVKEVSLVSRKGQWALDSYGKERCRRPVRKRRARRR